MKCTSMILGALAAVATAAPTAKRSFGGFQDFSSFGDFSGVNNFGFNSLDFGYLSSVNSLDFALLAQLSQVNQFDVSQFSGLFNNDVFDVAALLQFQQLATLIQLSSLGAFNSLSLNGLVFNQLSFGLIDNVNQFSFGGLIDQSLVPQLSSIANQGFAPAVVEVVEEVALAAPVVPEGVDFVTAAEEKAQDGASSLPAEV